MVSFNSVSPNFLSSLGLRLNGFNASRIDSSIWNLAVNGLVISFLASDSQ